MRSFLLSLLAIGTLSGCKERAYLLDHTIPTKTAMIAAELQRYGLDPNEAQCVGSRMAPRLSVWRIRQIRDALALQSGDQGRSRLWSIVPQIADEKVRADMIASLENCGIKAVDGQPVIAGNDVDPPAAANAPDPEAEAPGKEASSKLPNGPKDYKPNENLLSALDAYDRADFSAAARLARLAADANDSGAQQFLGGLYASGRGVETDPARAVRYFALAAEQGWSEAMNNLAKAYETGSGVKRNATEALKWYLLASARATEDEQMVTRNMRELLGSMSVAEIEKAADLARQWELGRSP